MSECDIDRFNYLNKYLNGEALCALSGFTLSSENYKEAVDLLCERYGNEQALISAHMQSLLDIKKIKSTDNIKYLRNLYNHVESCVRNLKAIKLDSKGYGSLLISLLKDKLPDDFKIVIVRKFGSSVWLLDVFKSDLPTDLHPSWNMREVLYVVDGVPVKGHKMLIPKDLEGLHESRQVVSSMMANARERFF